MSNAGDCRHFSGIQHRRCRASVIYGSVRGSDGRLPCLNNSLRSCDAECGAREPLTDVEARRYREEGLAFVNDVMAGICGECGEPTEKVENDDVVLLVCSEHGVTMRGCKRIGEHW